MKKKVLIVMVLVFLTLSSSIFAESKVKPNEIDHLGFNISFPVYVFDEYSTAAIQAGYQFKKVCLRFDLNIVNIFKEDGNTIFLMPSASIFYSEQGQAGTRFYQGISVGMETGLKNAFEGQTMYLNFLFGAELLALKNKAFFFEMGPGVGFTPKTGTYNGGTVIGGGMRMFF